MAHEEAYNLGYYAGGYATRLVVPEPDETLMQAAYRYEEESRKEYHRERELRKLRSEEDWIAYEKGVRDGIRDIVGLKLRQKLRQNPVDFQKLSFDKSKWELAEAKTWLRGHRQSAAKRVDLEHYKNYEFEQTDPGLYSGFWTVYIKSPTLRKTVKATVGRRETGGPSTAWPWVFRKAWHKTKRRGRK